jgi:hypothetical protein
MRRTDPALQGHGINTKMDRPGRRGQIGDTDL